LLELFVTYNIPSDLLSFHPQLDDDRTPLAAVTAHVADLHAMIAAKKSTEIREAAQGALLGALQGAPVNAPAGYAIQNDTMSSGVSSIADGGRMTSPLSPRRTGLAAPIGTAASVSSPRGGKAQLVIRLRPDGKDGEPVAAAASGAAMADLSRLPAELDARMERLDPEGRLRPTILSVSESWRQRRQRGLLSAPQEGPMAHAGQMLERDKCNDLLDALSRSGLLPFEDAQLHLLLASTHSFDATLMDTLVVQSTNPIDKVEHSTLIIAEAVFGRPKEELVLPTIQN
jgi:hypothetical protein